MELWQYLMPQLVPDVAVDEDVACLAEGSVARCDADVVATRLEVFLKQHRPRLAGDANGQLLAVLRGERCTCSRYTALADVATKCRLPGQFVDRNCSRTLFRRDTSLRHTLAPAQSADCTSGTAHVRASEASGTLSASLQVRGTGAM